MLTWPLFYILSQSFLILNLSHFFISFPTSWPFSLPSFPFLILSPFFFLSHSLSFPFSLVLSFLFFLTSYLICFTFSSSPLPFSFATSFQHPIEFVISFSFSPVSFLILSHSIDYKFLSLNPLFLFVKSFLLLSTF